MSVSYFDIVVIISRGILVSLRRSPAARCFQLRRRLSNVSGSQRAACSWLPQGLAGRPGAYPNRITVLRIRRLRRIPGHPQRRWLANRFLGNRPIPKAPRDQRLRLEPDGGDGGALVVKLRGSHYGDSPPSVGACLSISSLKHHAKNPDLTNRWIYTEIDRRLWRIQTFFFYPHVEILIINGKKYLGPF